MNDPLAKAEKAVTEAETNTVAVQLALAAVELAKTAQQQPQHTCQHHHVPVKQEFNAKKWLVIGIVVAGVGLVGALFAIAIAIAACCGTCCLVILRSIWREHQKGR
ncbi:hypothetical protein [Streptomyces sp. LNU-CPARS28]|uniref:hypothetical protein n=1 Tax=Streptomyces sp. LNU-CPARS28 TaxID=3137371 RepID=UPI0031371E19